MAELFPAFLKLERRRCVVVGGGRIAEQKLGSLLTAGAQVRVIAPAASPSIVELANTGRLEWAARAFSAGELDDAFLVIAATGNPEINETVFREAEKQGILCNAVDEPERCHFYFPAVVRRGDLQIAISTAGKSPALAQRIRNELEKQFAPQYAEWLVWLGRVRQLYFSRKMRPDARTAALHQIASRRVCERFLESHNVKTRSARHG